MIRINESIVLFCVLTSTSSSLLRSVRHLTKKGPGSNRFFSRQIVSTVILGVPTIWSFSARFFTSRGQLEELYNLCAKGLYKST